MLDVKIVQKYLIVIFVQVFIQFMKILFVFAIDVKKKFHSLKNVFIVKKRKIKHL